MAPTALLVVDVQDGLGRTDYWGPRNNPACEANIVALIAAWRARGEPVVFIRHDSVEDGSPLSPDDPGNAFKACLTGEPDLLVSKHVNSAFLGDPDLAAWLHCRHIDRIAICGITTNHCCETTARMGANLGFAVDFVLDATHTFDRVAPDGGTISADELMRVTATNLSGEFATIVSTAELVGSGERHLRSVG